MVVAVADTQDGGLAGLLSDAAQDRQGRTGKAVMVRYPLSQLEDPQAQVVPAAFRLVVHKAVTG
ncbi:hypothetical protein D3C75_1336530 [compost metagenome]